MEEEVKKVFGDCTIEVQDYIIKAFKYFSNIDMEEASKNFMMLCQIKDVIPEFKIVFDSSKPTQFDSEKNEINMSRKNYLTFLHECGHAFHYVYDRYGVPEEFDELKNQISSDDETQKKCTVVINELDECVQKINNAVDDESISDEEYSELLIKQKAFLLTEDLIDAVCDGKTQHGHGSSYYSDSSVAFSEVFADYVAIRNSSEKNFSLTLLQKCLGEKMVNMLEKKYKDVFQGMPTGINYEETDKKRK